jgi:hypothetical protein
MVDESTAPTGPGLGLPSSRAPDVIPASPARIGRYAILGLLGRGGMGAVYLGFDEQLDRQVAIKLLARRTEPSPIPDRLRREALALARLTHPNVVAVHEVGEADGQMHLVMERVDGVTLRAWLSERRRSPAEILAVMRQAGQGLAAAHAAGLVHRDFKPDNIMIGADDRVRLMDFGLARAIDGSPSMLSQTIPPTLPALGHEVTTPGPGTPGYMAPEQRLRAPQDPRCDIFSFCVVLFEALHGQLPRASDGRRELRGRAVPAWLGAVIRRGLAPTPEQRWASMSDLLAALTHDRRPLLRRIGALAVTLMVVLAATLGGSALREAAAQQHADGGGACSIDDGPLVRRAAIEAQVGRAALARRDLVSAPAIAPTALPADGDVRIEAHVQLVRLLVRIDPRVARAHAEIALATAPQPDPVRPRSIAVVFEVKR